MKRPEALDEGIVLDPKKYIVSKTDTKGVIKYANDYFMEICGYSKDELIGKPHNIIRHPDMPKIVFKLMWDRIQKNQNIIALVKNLAKDGRYYWVMTEFEAKKDKLTNEIVEYTAFRKAAPQKAVKTVIPIYKKLVELEKEGGMEASQEYLVNFLTENNTSYDDFVDKITGNRGMLKIFFNLMKKIFR